MSGTQREYQYPAGTPNNNPWLDVIREVYDRYGGEDGRSGACQFGRVVSIGPDETTGNTVERYPGARVEHWGATVTITGCSAEADAELADADRIVRERRTANVGA